MIHNTIAARNHSLIIDENDVVWGCGNSHKQLGSPTNKKIKNVTKVPHIPNCSSVSCGVQHSLFLTFEHKVWSCGINNAGQLAHNSNIPTMIEGLPLITAISAGHRHSLFLTTDAAVWGCGSSNHGELGIGKVVKTWEPVKINLPPIQFMTTGPLSSLFIDFQGAAWACGGVTNKDIPTKLDIEQKIISGACGYDYGLLLDENGRVWGFGENNVGQLGIGTKEVNSKFTQISSLPPVSQVFAGFSHSAFICDGGVWVAGENDCFQLGLGDNAIRETPELLGNLPPIASVALGNYHSLLLDNEGKMWYFGGNPNGQLPCKDANAPTPVCIEIRAKMPRLRGSNVKSARKTKW